jgi:AraC family transcriptional regulator
MNEVAYLEAIQVAVDYIEENLDETIRVESIATQVGFSQFHFHRIFAGAVGESISSYQRRRRLSRAARELKDSTTAIMEIALKAGFNSQESFTRAFKTLFGCSPGHYRKQGGLIAMEKKRLTIEVIKHLQGGLTMEPTFVEFPGQSVVGIAGAFTQDSTSEIGKLWDTFVARCKENPSLDMHVSYGVCMPEHPLITKKQDESFVYLASVRDTDSTGLPPEMVHFQIPPGRYAVFTHKGPISTFVHTVRYIWGTWLAANRALYREGPDFELYDSRFDPESTSGEVDIYIPIRD